MNDAHISLVSTSFSEDFVMQSSLKMLVTAVLPQCKANKSIKLFGTREEAKENSIALIISSELNAKLTIWFSVYGNFP